MTHSDVPALALELARYRQSVKLDEPWLRAVPMPAAELAHAIPALVAYLEEELNAPSGALDLQRLRALLTVRPPAPLPTAQRELLYALLATLDAQRGEVDATTLPSLARQMPQSAYPAAAQTALWRGDITRLKVDAIVNAANTQMLGCFVPGHHCIDNAIHWHAGPQLRLDCAALMQQQGHDEATGTAKLTRAYNLPSRFVLHTVGPIVQGDQASVRQQAQLTSSYTACLDLAEAHAGITSVAFCAVSTGIFGFPHVTAARIALHTVADWLAAGPRRVQQVVFNVFSEADEQVYRNILEVWA